MAKQAYTEGNLLAEVYSDGQFRFIESVTDNDKPAKHTFWFNSRNFEAKSADHTGSGRFSRHLEDVLADKGFPYPAEELYAKGVAMLKRNGIYVPTEPTGYPELQVLDEDLQSRPEIDLEDVKPGMLIAYMHPTITYYQVRLFNIGEPYTGCSIEKNIFYIEPTSVSNTYVEFWIEPGTSLAFPCEKMKIGDERVTEYLERRYPVGWTKIVAATEDDMRIVKRSIPEKLDGSMEKL